MTMTPRNTAAGAGLLVYFHCAPGTGFAIGRLESVFFRMACAVTGDAARVYFAYPTTVSEGRTPPPVSPESVLCIDPTTRSTTELQRISATMRRLGITSALGFDQQPCLPIYTALRDGGVSTIVSYWGAPMSSLKGPLKLAVKKLEVAMDRSGPDRYVFESEAMRRTGTHGRGLRRSATTVIRLGVDVEQFRPAPVPDSHAHDTFGIPRTGKIVFYSGHMEERKGVAVLVKAARALAVERGRRDIFFVILGNRSGEADRFKALYAGTPAESQIVFGGYRTDIARLMQSASLGVIPSTGWDSSTRTAVELTATGVPLLVSDLQGLAETVVADVTGRIFPPGDHDRLATEIERLLDDATELKRMSETSRARAVRELSETRQIEALATLFSPAQFRSGFAS